MLHLFDSLFNLLLFLQIPTTDGCRPRVRGRRQAQGRVVGSLAVATSNLLVGNEATWSRDLLGGRGLEGIWKKRQMSSLSKELF